MKLFIVAALVAVSSAGRLEPLERSYLPPDNSIQGNFGSNGFGSAPNGFGNGANGHTNGFGSHGFGSNGHRTNGNGLGSGAYGSNGGFLGLNGFGSNGGRNGAFTGAPSNQYLPPNQRPSGSGSNGFNFGRPGINAGCSSCGSRYPSQQYNQGSHSSVPSASYGVPQFGSSFGSPNGFGSGFHGGSAHGNPGSSGSSFGGQGSGNFGSQGAPGRQYLAPALSSQGRPQQPFDDKSGYIY